MGYTPTYATWYDWPTTSTPVTVGHLNNVDDWIGQIANGDDGGDNPQVWTAADTTGQRIHIPYCSQASPDTSVAGPLVKIVRTEEVTSGIVSDGVEQLAALLSVARGMAGTRGQPVGIAGMATTLSTQSAYNDDACGVYGIGRVSSTGTGSAIGAFFAGQKDTATATAATGLEVQARNYSGSNDSYSASGYNASQAIWVAAAGDTAARQSSAGVLLGNPFGNKFDVGIAFSSSNGGPAATTSIRDDGNATTSIDIRGSHTTGIDLLNATISGVGLRMAGNIISFTERSDPGAPSTNQAFLYAKDNGSGKTQLVVRFPTGAVQVLATEP